MSDLRRQHIGHLADVMLEGAGVTSLPVKPIDIAVSLDIHVVAKPPDQVGASGWLMKHGEQFAIAYATHYANTWISTLLDRSRTWALRR